MASGRFLGLLAAAGASSALGQSPEALRGADFVSGHRGHVGDRVEIVDCFVAGTTGAFIRCETPEGDASYTLETATMLPADVERLNRGCPTGSRDRPGCRFAVTGIVRAGRLPSLDDARLGPYRRRP